MDSGISPHELEDEGHWLTQRQVDDFHDAVMMQTDDSTIFREAGRFMVNARSMSAIRQFIMGFLTPVQAYSMLGKIASYLNRGCTFQSNKISGNKVEIVIKPLEGVVDKPYQCENRKGSFEAVAKYFTNKLPVLEHPVCVHEGGSHCRYILSWEEPAFLRWKRIRNYLAIPSILAMVASGFLLPVGSLVVLGSLLTLVILGLSHYAQYVEKRDIYAKIELQGNAANRLLDQITIGYNNALLVQEIGQAVTSILDIDKLLKFVMETLHKRLEFDRGMIMLASPDRARLVYVSGYGYSPELKKVLQETQFHLDNPRSKGPFVVAFKQQKPILVSDVGHVQKQISSRSADLVETLGVSSFICVPIVYEGKSEGILAVDNYRSHRPHNQSEVSLLMGIAPQIAISLNNASSLRQIMESEERFRTLSENSPDIIYTADNNGFITYINPAANEILGYAAEEVIGRHYTEFLNPDDADALLEAFERIKQGNKIIKHLEAKFRSKDGMMRLFDMSGAPKLNAAAEMMGVVGTMKDVTEQRKLEYELRHASKMNALGRLTGGIAHDFNNILQAISSYNQLLTINKAEADPDWKYLYNINGLTKRATDLIKQLLIFSRRVDSKLAPVDINGEIKNYCELLVSTLPPTITVKLNLADDLNLINGDTTQLGQVIMNLVVNAKDAMSQTGEMTIQTRNIELSSPLERGNVRVKAGRYVHFRISDTGCGIERENLDRIFEPFFTTKAGKGTGIGLSVVYGVVKNHGGYIFCTSEPGRGTTFELYFPTLNILMTEEKKETVKKPALTRGHETILLVDDEPSLLETGQELLSYLGYTVLTASSGENALVMIEREGKGIDIVIMDLMMPGIGGEKCLVEIMKIFPEMKVMIASGNIASAKVGTILKAGAKGFLQKPYYIEDLSNKIREILDDRGQSG
ncbi:MAG: PAS domain S-box protein [Deltaproteobacteria bacterium]|nr:PAS domain S-box protein [Deltaproteobacteria bacterium]